MNKLTQEELNQIREVRIHKILGVNDTGRDIKIKCPLHSERTPSFVLYKNNTFHCFGCNVHGQGAIDFCVELGYSFVEALTELIKYL